MADVLEPEGTWEGTPGFDVDQRSRGRGQLWTRREPKPFAAGARVAAFLAAQRRLAELQATILKDRVRDLKLRTASRRGEAVPADPWPCSPPWVVALIAVLIFAMVRDAMNARGLVVAGFSAPPSFAARGMSGDVLAGDLTSRIAAVDRFTNANSLTRSDDVRAAGADSVKLEIPQTGVSLDDVARFLRRRLGLRGKPERRPPGRRRRRVASRSSWRWIAWTRSSFAARNRTWMA